MMMMTMIVYYDDRTDVMLTLESPSSSNAGLYQTSSNRLLVPGLSHPPDRRRSADENRASRELEQFLRPDRTERLCVIVCIVLYTYCTFASAHPCRILEAPHYVFGCLCMHASRADRVTELLLQQPFYDPLFGTTQVSRYQKDKPFWILLKQT